MAATKTSPKRKSTSKKKDVKTDLIHGYKDYVLTHGKEPESIYLFAKEHGFSEADFYNYFASFKALQSEIWHELIGGTINAIQSDSAYKEFNSRERLLSFYYTLIERLKQERSYVMHTFRKVRKTEINPSFLKSVRHTFNAYAEELVKEGIEKGEIKRRPIVSNRYKDAMWLQMLFIIGFWSRDDSAAFEKTDAAIEKAVNLSFELMGEGPLDMMLDFGKFLYQNR